MHIGTLWRGAVLAAKAAAAKTTARAPSAKQPLEHVAKVDAFGASMSPGAAKAGHVVGPKAALPTAKSAAATIAGAIAGGVAVHVDLAPVETGALVGIRQQIIGVGDFRKALARLGVILVAVGVQFLGQLAIGGLDVLLGCAAGHAQYGIGILCHIT